MSNKPNRKWTDNEDQIALRYIKANINNLSKGFLLISEHLTDAGMPRTPIAVQSHWYTVLSKRPEALCFFTASSQHVAKNRKNGVGQPINTPIWKRFLRILQSITN
jgi:hypothetical protein